MYQNPLFDKIEIQETTCFKLFGCHYFTKINNYKGRKKRTYTKWKRLEKASLKMETKLGIFI
jgi:hypothetical protein